jgi:hypothetical protein
MLFQGLQSSEVESPGLMRSLRLQKHHMFRVTGRKPKGPVLVTLSILAGEDWVARR